MDSSTKGGSLTDVSQNPSPPSSEYRLPSVAVVGVVAGVWGHWGEVRVQPQTDNPQRFSKGSLVMAQGRPLQIQSCRWHKGLALIKLIGIDTREDAMSLQGAILEVSLDQVPPLSPGSYYHFQILDMEVWTLSGELLGAVTDILSTGSNDVYVVSKGGSEILLPAIQDVILDVDLEKGRITVDLPEGLR